MTFKTTAIVGMALILAASNAHAKTSQILEFDRAAGNYTTGEVKIASPRSDRAKRRVRQRAKPAVVTNGDHVVVAKSGARASVSIVARSHFVCLIEKLEATGYRIDFMGGYAHRGNSSAHPTGNALDINQTGRNRVTRPFPAGVTAMAAGCGLTHGAVWSHPDQGHFEMPRKYGYVVPHRRHRYASAR